jgi:hypothetical protein
MKIKKNGKTITLSESDMKRIVKKLLRESVDNKTVVIECIKENTTLKDLADLPESCVAMIAEEDVMKALECATSIDARTLQIIQSKIVPISTCVAGKMKGGNTPMDEKY